MSRNMQKKSKGKRKTRSGASGVQFSRMSKVDNRMVKFNSVIPDRVLVKMKYLSTSPLTAVASDTASRQFRANGIYDVDPALASTAIAGFAEWMAFYGSYRVIATEVDCEFINLDTAPTVYNVGFETVFFTANTKNYPYFGEPNQISKLSAGIGANPVRLKKRMQLQHLLGDTANLTDQDYTGGSAANPASLLYVSIAQSSPSAVAIVNGSFVRCQLSFDVEFFRRRNLNQ